MRASASNPDSGIPFRSPRDASKEPHTLRARWVFPVASPPIPGGCVTIDGGRIAAVGKTAPGSPVVDLGNVAILPGLVNAHTHLELSDLENPLGKRAMRLPEWIELVVAHRRSRTSGAAAAAVRRGVAESVRLGTTLLGDIVQIDWPRELFQRWPLGIVALLELIGPTSDRVGAVAAAAISQIEQGPPAPWVTLGLSPHAPYSVCRELLEEVVRLSRRRNVPVAMHVAESPEELQLLAQRTGPMRSLLEKIGAWPAGGFEPASIQAVIRSLLRAHRVLIVHGNYLQPEEIELVGRCRDRAAVIYCPRTHQYFGHSEYPLLSLLRRGIPVALGTDSRASSPNLSVLEEMRTVARRHPEVARERVLAMATLVGAAALGRAGTTGSLTPGKSADLVVVALGEEDRPDPHELLFDSQLPVVATWIAGRCVWADPEFADAVGRDRLRLAPPA